MSANWGSMEGGNTVDRNAKIMLRAWFVLACAGLVFVMFGGRI